MRKPDIYKTADELESDSCFQLLAICNARVAEVEDQLAGLRRVAQMLKFGSAEERANYCAQRERVGELFGLAHCQGGLEAHCQMKRGLAALARQREASQEVA